MSETLTRMIESWGGRAVVVHHDAPTGTWIFICLHDNTLGPCTGGSRMKVYDALEDALRDAMRLSEGMTAKWAAINGSFGGGKAVLAVPRPMEGDERRGLLERYGDLVEALAGGFWTGEDMGTTSADMQVIATRTRWVHGFDPDHREKIDPSPYTARGVFRGIEAAVRTVYGEADLDGRSVLIQGTGAVGFHLGRLLREAGATLLVSDIDAERAAEAAAALDAQVVPADEVYATPCDVYAPCAVGATLNPSTVPLLACRIVAGSANNQLASEEDGERLAGRGVLYVPDYIINAGGALSFALIGEGVPPGETLFSKIDTIGETVAEILAEAAERGESPVRTARRRVERTLSRRD